MPRQRLLARLRDGEHLDDPTAFVLLASYFTMVGLSAVENRLMAKNVTPQSLVPIPRSTEDFDYEADDIRVRLLAAEHDVDFDEIALAWLKGVDRLLVKHRGEFEAAAIDGVDGKPYRVRAANNFIASFFAAANREIAGNRKQSLALAAYCRNFRIVPADDVGGLRIDCKSHWGNAYVHDRLYDASRRGLRFLSWPLRSALRVDRIPIPGSESGANYVTVFVAEAVAARQAELTRAVTTANEQRAQSSSFPSSPSPRTISNSSRDCCRSTAMKTCPS